MSRARKKIYGNKERKIPCQDIQNLPTSNIRKRKNDAKKGKIFTVIGREIVMAVKAGGPDPANNSKLRDVIAKAKANNMPNDTIDRGIKEGSRCGFC